MYTISYDGCLGIIWGYIDEQNYSERSEGRSPEPHRIVPPSRSMLPKDCVPPRSGLVMGENERKKMKTDGPADGPTDGRSKMTRYYMGIPPKSFKICKFFRTFFSKKIVLKFFFVIEI